VNVSSSGTDAGDASHNTNTNQTASTDVDELSVASTQPASTGPVRLVSLLSSVARCC